MDKKLHIQKSEYLPVGRSWLMVRSKRFQDLVTKVMAGYSKRRRDRSDEDWSIEILSRRVL